MAANEQKGFIVYLDSYDMISMLSQEQKGALLDAMFSVYGCCERPEMDQATAITFVTIERYLKDNREKWLNSGPKERASAQSRRQKRPMHVGRSTESNAHLCRMMLMHAQVMLIYAQAMLMHAHLCSSNAQLCSAMP